jgi:HYR domain
VQEQVAVNKKVPSPTSKRLVCALWLAFALLACMTAVAQDASKSGSISTDKLDYQPGETVTIVGQNWAPGETILLQLHEEGTGVADLNLTSTAAGDGTFINQDFAPEQRQLGVKFTVTAKGETSGDTASLQFFDGIVYSGLAGDYNVTVDTGTIVRGTTDIQNHADDVTTVITLPFAFKLYGQTPAFTRAALSSNGVLQFGSNSTAYVPESLKAEKQLNTGATDFIDSIVAYWDDLTTSGTSPLGGSLPLGIYTKTDGSSPNRVFHIEWRAIHPKAATKVENFEVRLFETDNHFEVIYGRTDDLGQNASIGVIHRKGSNYTQYSFHESGSVVNGRRLIYSDAPVTDEKPVVTVPADISVEATDATGAIVTFTATATDKEDGPLTPTCTPPSGAKFKLGTTVVTCTAQDSANNTGTATFNVKVGDTGAPVGPTDQVETAEATSSAGATVQFTSTAHDTVDGEIQGTCVPPSGSVFAVGTTTVNCQAKDSAGNVGKWTITVKVLDKTGPVVTVPPAIAEEATSSAGANVTFTASATDTVDGAITPKCSPASGTVFALGVTEVTCTATDAANNSNSASFNVTVKDTKAPVVTVPADITKEATGPAGAIVNFTVTAADTVDPDPTITCSKKSGDTFPVGTTTVSCTAKDKSGNESTPAKTFKVTVEDKTPPELTVPANIVEEATSAAGAVVNFSATAKDLVDPSPIVTCDKKSGDTFPLGATTVSCTAKDHSDNVSDAKTFTVAVRDTTPPELTVSGNITKEATGPSGASLTYSATATDLVDGSVTPACTPASGATFVLGATTVSCTAKDKAGNEAAAKTFTITVVDTTPPVVTVPANILLEAAGPSGAAAMFTSSANDLVDGSVATQCSAVTGAVFPLGTTTVTCTATDAHKNTGTGSFTITVVDTTPPAITVPADIKVTASAATGNTVSYQTSAIDLVSGIVPTTCVLPSGSVFPLGTSSVTCSATDAAGNSSIKKFNISVTYAWSGFLQPINVDPNNISIFKLGSTVPVKFQLTGASAGVVNATAKLYTTMVTNEVLGDELEAVTSTPASTGNLFRYDATSNQYIYNWGTKGSIKAGTYQIRVDLGDGVQRTVFISLR